MKHQTGLSEHEKMAGRYIPVWFSGHVTKALAFRVDLSYFYRFIFKVLRSWIRGLEDVGR